MVGRRAGAAPGNPADPVGHHCLRAGAGAPGGGPVPASFPGPGRWGARAQVPRRAPLGRRLYGRTPRPRRHLSCGNVRLELVGK